MRPLASSSNARGNCNRYLKRREVHSSEPIIELCEVVVREDGIILEEEYDELPSERRTRESADRLE